MKIHLLCVRGRLFLLCVAPQGPRPGPPSRSFPLKHLHRGAGPAGALRPLLDPGGTLTGQHKPAHSVRNQPRRNLAARSVRAARRRYRSRAAGRLQILVPFRRRRGDSMRSRHRALRGGRQSATAAATIRGCGAQDSRSGEAARRVRPAASQVLEGQPSPALFHRRVRGPVRQDHPDPRRARIRPAADPSSVAGDRLRGSRRRVLRGRSRCSFGPRAAERALSTRAAAGSRGQRLAHQRGRAASASGSRVSRAARRPSRARSAELAFRPARRRSSSSRRSG